MVTFADYPAADFVDPTCTGSYADPTAPPGKLCIYVNTSWNVRNLAAYPGPTGTRSFFISYQPWNAAAAGNMYMDATWAFTAPRRGPRFDTPRHPPSPPAATAARARQFTNGAGDRVSFARRPGGPGDDDGWTRP